LNIPPPPPPPFEREREGGELIRISLPYQMKPITSVLHGHSWTSGQESPCNLQKLEVHYRVYKHALDSASGRNLRVKRGSWLAWTMIYSRTYLSWGVLEDFSVPLNLIMVKNSSSNLQASWTERRLDGVNTRLKKSELFGARWLSKRVHATSRRSSLH
jgi:hypothetical protein